MSRLTAIPLAFILFLFEDKTSLLVSHTVPRPLFGLEDFRCLCLIDLFFVLPAMLIFSSRFSGARDVESGNFGASVASKLIGISDSEDGVVTGATLCAASDELELSSLLEVPSMSLAVFDLLSHRIWLVLVSG